MRRWMLLLLLAVSLFASEPWTDNDLVDPVHAAQDLKSAMVIHVGFPVLYRAAHIPGSLFAGPGSKPEGIVDLKKAIAGQPRDREIILYCGCCPFDKCPNIRPAFAALHEMGFTHIRVTVIHTNLKTDWIDQNFPIERHQD